MRHLDSVIRLYPVSLFTDRLIGMIRDTRTAEAAGELLLKVLRNLMEAF